MGVDDKPSLLKHRYPYIFTQEERKELGLDNFEKDDDFDIELTPEEEAEIDRAIQDCNDGFFYTSIVGEDGRLTHELECNKCKRIGGWLERPFPHKLNCPMKRG